MSSFILHSKPWLLAAMAILGVELTYYHVAHPDRAERTNFLANSYYREESVQRMTAFEKLRDLGDSDPDILVLGDSSANHNVIPHVVMKELPGFKVVNMGIASNVGYPGYRYIAEYMLRRSKNIKYLVLYNTLTGGQPRKMLVESNDPLMRGIYQLMADDIYNEFLHPGRRLLQIPTLAARDSVFTFVAYKNGRIRPYGRQCFNEGYLMFHSTNRICHGWSRETDNPTDFPDNSYTFRILAPNTPVVTDETFLDRRTGEQRSYIEHTYEQFADLARRHNVKLAIIHNPTPASTRTRFQHIFQWDRIETAFARFKANNPDVDITHRLDYWPDDKFSIFSHVSTLYSEESALRVARLLKPIIERDGTKPAERPPDFIARAAPERAELRFSEYPAAFGWGPLERDAHGRAWRYVGPRDLAYLYSVVKPGRDYRIRIEFHNVASRAALGRLKVRLNETELAETGRQWSGPYFIDLRVPADAVSRYLGWFKIEFDFRAPPGTAAAGTAPETPGKKLAVSRITVVPIDDKSEAD